MTYKLNTLGRETIRNFFRNNSDTNECVNEYFDSAEKTANRGIFNLAGCIGAVVLLPHQTIHRYEIMLMLRPEHYAVLSGATTKQD